MIIILELLNATAAILGLWKTWKSTSSTTQSLQINKELWIYTFIRTNRPEDSASCWLIDWLIDLFPERILK